MRGPSSAEMRTERFQVLTFLGLVADDVTLAMLHYPNLNSDESRAVSALANSLEPTSISDVFPKSIRRTKAMGDSSAILRKAVEADEESSSNDDFKEVLADLRARLTRVSDRTASAEDLQTLQDFSERLAKITLMLTERFASERGARDWMPKASDSFVA
jgi:hypothetical protein